MKKHDIWLLLKTISVEPVILLNAIAISFHNVVYGYGMYRVICQKMFADHPDIDCNDLSHHNSTSSRPELDVQRAAADWQMATRLSYVIPATFADIFLGALGDRHGRKFNILLGIFGMMISVFPFAILFAYPKTMPLYVLLITYLLAGLTGFVAIIVISSFAYLADTVIDKDLLTVRMTLVQVFINVGYIVGPLMAGATSKVLSTSIQACVTLAILSVAFIVGFLVLRQIPPAAMRRRMTQRLEPNQIDPNQIATISTSAHSPEPEKATKHLQIPAETPACLTNHAPGKTIAFESTNNNNIQIPAKTMTAESSNSSNVQIPAKSTAADSTNQSESSESRARSPLAECWRSFAQTLAAGFALMKEVWSTYTKPRQGHYRLYILAASVIFFVSLAAEQGLQTSLFVLYVQKAPLSWNQEMIGYYNSVNNGVTIAGTAAGIVVLKKLLGFEDTTVLLIAMASGMTESLLIAFADDRTWIIFLSAVIGSVSTLVKPCLKSFVAKLVDPEEVGKAFTVFGVAQNLAYLVTSVVFNNIYKATLESFPGFVYVFAAFVQLLIFLLIVWVHVDQKRASGQSWRGMNSIRACFTGHRSSKATEKSAPAGQPRVEVTVM